MASGVVATFSLTLLFFLINRLRHRKVQGREAHLHHMHHHRPPNMISDDQRSIGSIGYIAGNYNGEIYDQSNPYQLWKPPNGCFPRGEAPPPYEEVIGLSQATADHHTLGASTTVSLGHHQHQHRTLPLSVCAEAGAPLQSTTNDFQGYVPQPLQSATTNLINININNAGTITSVAAGETHQVPLGATTNTNNGSASGMGMNSNPYK